MAQIVSILIPSHNAEAYIGATLESVLAQTWRPLEIIVVDDGSTDGSADVVRSFEKAGVILIEQPNRGAASARNAAIRAASGDFVQLLDSDDLIDPLKIELQMERLIASPNCVASAEWGRFYEEPEETLFLPEENWQDMAPIEWLVSSRSDGGGMMFPALWLIPMPIIRSVGPWREDLSLADDAEYFTRVLLASEGVLFCPRARCRYRSGLTGSLSGRKTQLAWRSHFRVNELCESYVRAREDSARVRRGFALSWQHLAHASYPYDPALARQALARAQALHPVTIRPDGGLAFKTLSRLIGWRLARRLQVATGRP